MPDDFSKLSEPQLIDVFHRSPIATPVSAKAGAAFGWMRHRTDSTLDSAVMHAAHNALFFVAVAGEKAHWRE
jgi:membrane protease YdiL (CAAX protease family)